MRLSFMIVMALLGLAERAAYALCVPGTVEVCFANGKQGTRTCRANGFFGPCEVPDDPPPPSGYGRPKYKVLTVVYAPPGKQGGGSTSAVSYGNGSTWGSTTTCEDGFKQEYTTTVSATGGFLGESSGSLIFGYGRSSTDSKATEIKKSSSTTISLGGPSVDGIDHDRDLIWLWLNPKLRVSLPTATAIEWKLDNSEPMDIQYVYVGHLKDPSQMPPGVAQRLAYYGITTADYAEILEADPYAYGAVPVSSRYVSLNTTFPYEPPYAPGDPVPTLNFTATYSSTDTSGSEVVNEYTSGVTWEGGLDFISLVQAKLKVESKWTWTDTKSLSTATGTEESASVTIGGPAFGYTGPTDMGVYYDLLYKSFLFVPIDGAPPTVTGWVYSRSNRPVAGKQVLLSANGVTYRTFANADGEFRFFGVPSGRRMELRVNAVRLLMADTGDAIDVELP